MQMAFTIESGDHAQCAAAPARCLVSTSSLPGFEVCPRSDFAVCHGAPAPGLKFTGNPVLLLPMPERLRILFADDHEIFRAGLRQVFASDPQIEVIVEAADGDVALRAIISQKPDVAVLDFDLPRRNALEIAQELRGLRQET